MSSFVALCFAYKWQWRLSISAAIYFLFNSVGCVFFFRDERNTIFPELSPPLIDSLIIFDCFSPCADVVFSDNHINNKGKHSEIVALFVCGLRLEETDCLMKSLMKALHTFIYLFIIGLLRGNKPTIKVSCWCFDMGNTQQKSVRNSIELKP